MKSAELKVHTYVVGPFFVNCYVVHSENDSAAAIIDPGGDEPVIAGEIKKLQLAPKYVLLTHGHIDHVFAAQAIRERYQIPVVAPVKEKEFLSKLQVQCAFLGLPDAPELTVDIWVDETDTLRFGSTNLSILHTPGHTPGGCAYLGPHEVFVGDTLFASSIGRTDLPGGQHDVLIRSIRNKLFSLPDDFIVYPGHGPSTAIGNEKKFNPFVRGL